jgi:hypothetical protein
MSAVQRAGARTYLTVPRVRGHSGQATERSHAASPIRSPSVVCWDAALAIKRERPYRDNKLSDYLDGLGDAAFRGNVMQRAPYFRWALSRKGHIASFLEARMIASSMRAATTGCI